VQLSILIVNWNSKDYLRRCLESIRLTCAMLTKQIVVVDGGSFDGCAELIADEFPEVEFVQSQENIGFARSNNLGFCQVTGDAVLLLNPDTEVRPGAVAALLDNLMHLPAAGILGARLLNSDESLQFSSVHPLPTAWNVAIDSEWVRRRWWRRKGPTADAAAMEVEAVSGACMMLLAGTFRRLGGFDSRYFMYAEDMDLCCQVRRAGMKVYHAPQARIVHHGGGSSRTQFSKFQVVMIREALKLYILKNHGRVHCWMYRRLMSLSACLRILVLLVAWLTATGSTRLARKASVHRWWAVVKWSIGMEGWARIKFSHQPHPPPWISVVK